MFLGNCLERLVSWNSDWAHMENLNSSLLFNSPGLVPLYPSLLESLVVVGVTGKRSQPFFYPHFHLYLHF